MLELGGTEYVVRGRGRFTSLDDIRAVALGTGPGGTPVTVGDVATVQIGPEIRRGIAEVNGRGEVVTGWVVMRYGANPVAVIDGVKARMAEVQRALSARNTSAARRTPLIGAYPKLFIPALTIIPGLIAVVLLPKLGDTPDGGATFRVELPLS